MLFLYIGNSNVMEVRALTNSSTGVLDNGATVTVTLYEADGTTEVGGVSPLPWPVTLSSVTESPMTGKYRATLDSAIAILETKEYIAEIAVVGSASEVGNWQEPVRAVIRRNDL